MLDTLISWTKSLGSSEANEIYCTLLISDSVIISNFSLVLIQVTKGRSTWTLYKSGVMGIRTFLTEPTSRPVDIDFCMVQMLVKSYDFHTEALRSMTGRKHVLSLIITTSCGGERVCD